jgi:acyl-CoA synthetase (AMP-forming)/AMP-acid ligase II
MLVHDIVADNARHRGDEEALIFEDGTRRTWRAFDEHSDRVAAVLDGMGVGRGDRVCALARNCLEMFDLLIACNRLGAIFAPINYRFSVPEIEYVLTDSAPVVFCGHSEFADAVGRLMGGGAGRGVRKWLSFGGSIEGTEDLEALMAAATLRPFAVDIDPDDPSWICYTGGTTGRSKGVLLSHRNLLAGATNFGICNRIDERSVYMLVGAMFHIVLAVPVAYWLVGARTVVMNFEPGRAIELMQREGVTNLIGTGTILKMLVEEMEARPREGTRLRNMDTGGAPVSAAIARRVIAAFGCTVAQIYGQTESTLMATYLWPEQYDAGLREGATADDFAALTSVGRRAPANLVGIFDDRGQSCPTGAVGEVCVRGETVMLGYWNKPELTAETIRDGWLRTGDLGWMDDRGQIHLVDRKKDMIITGGENVYSSEVELVLGDHPDVSECVVIGVPDAHWGERVHAILVPVQGRRADPGALAEFCRQRLSGYKVPKQFEIRESLPRMPTGKIAKGQLRREFWQGRDSLVQGV